MNYNSENNQISLLIDKYRRKNHQYKYPLLDDAFSNQDLLKGIRVILSGQLTMSKETKDFEKNICKKNEVKYAVILIQVLLQIY